MKVNLRLYLMMGLVSFFALGMSGCEEELKEYDNPSITLEAGGGATETTASFTVTPENAELCKYLYAEKAAGVTELPTTEVLAKGTDIAANAATTVELTGLTPGKTYTVTVLARKGGTISLVKSLDLTTRALPTANAVLDASKSTRTSLTFTITPVDATKVAYILKEKAATAPTVDDVLASGTEVSATETTTVTVENLSVNTEYLLYIAAERGQWKSELLSTAMRTSDYTQLLTMTLIESGAYGYHVRPSSQDAGFAHVGLETGLVEFLKLLAGATEADILEVFGFVGTGEQDIVWRNGEMNDYDEVIEVLPASAYTVLAADAVWEDEPDEEGKWIITVKGETSREDFTTLLPEESDATVTIEWGEITPTSIRTICTPDADIAHYFQLFATTAAVDEFIAENGLDEFKIFLTTSDQAFQLDDVDDWVWDGLDPETSYTMALLGVDTEGKWAYVREDRSTPVLPLVESELFTDLLGDWEATINNREGTSVSFDVTIAQGVDDATSEQYRKLNRLVALGFDADPSKPLVYRSPQDLLDGAEGDYWQEYPEEAIKDYGPKWFLEIAEGDVVTVPASLSMVPLHYYKNAPYYLIAGNADLQIKEDPFQVSISPDKNTITVQGYNNYYPTICAQSSTGLSLVFLGTSDLVLTRKASGTAVLSKYSAVRRGAQKSAASVRALRKAPIASFTRMSYSTPDMAPEAISPFRFSQVNLRNPKAAKFFKAAEKYAAERSSIRSIEKK